MVVAEKRSGSPVTARYLAAPVQTPTSQAR